MSTPVSGVVQIVARNVAPLAGILFLGWSARSVLYLYFIDTLLALAVILAGVLRHFQPPNVYDGWAARLNGEVGVVAGALFIVAFMAVPLGVWLLFMLGGDLGWRETLADRNFLIAAAWQAVAALLSYRGLVEALATRTPDELRLKRRFALVLLRWVALIFCTQFTALLPTRYSVIVLVAIYAAVSVWTEVAPDHFLRRFPGAADGEPRKGASTQPLTEPAPRRKRRR